MNSEYLDDFLSRFTYNTNAIEGCTITLAQTVSIIVNGYVSSGANVREIYEVENHKKAYEYMIDNISIPLDVDYIRDLHKILMDRIHHEAGMFKKNDNAILGASFETTKKELVLQEMKFWVEDIYQELSGENRRSKICEIIARYHIRFEKIHPFADGNGRIGRLLINKLLIEKELLPVVILNEEKHEYYEYLANENSEKLGVLLESLISVEENRKMLFKNSESRCNV